MVCSANTLRTALSQPTHMPFTMRVWEGGEVSTPASGFAGSEAFTYTIADGNGGTASGTVSVTVTPSNESD